MYRVGSGATAVTASAEVANATGLEGTTCWGSSTVHSTAAVRLALPAPCSDTGSGTHGDTALPPTHAGGALHCECFQVGPGVC
jgi:hypothetical protein